MTPVSPSDPSIRSMEGGASKPRRKGHHNAPSTSSTDLGTDRPRSLTWSMPKAFDDALDHVSGLFIGGQDEKDGRAGQPSLSDDENISKVRKKKRGGPSPGGAAVPPEGAGQEAGGAKQSKEQLLLNSLLFTLRPVVEGVVYLKKPHQPSKRRWAILDQNALYVFKGPRDPHNPLVIPMIGACVRPVPHKQTTFQVLASSGTYLVSVDTPKDLYQWVSKMTEICEHLVMVSIDQRPLGGGEAGGSAEAAPELGVSEPTKQAVLELQRSEEANRRCADCGREDPEWASTNLGVFICIDCSGTHRRMGTHVSKVRSLHLDKWQPEHMARLQELGNRSANLVWEHNLPEGVKPSPHAGADERELYIRQKYEEGRFRKDWEVYAASHRVVTLTGDGLKTALLNLLRVDDDFRNEVKVLLGLMPSSAATFASTANASMTELPTLEMPCTPASLSSQPIHSSSSHPSPASPLSLSPSSSSSVASPNLLSTSSPTPNTRQSPRPSSRRRKNESSSSPNRKSNEALQIPDSALIGI